MKEVMTTPFDWVTLYAKSSLLNLRHYFDTTTDAFTLIGSTISTLMSAILAGASVILGVVFFFIAVLLMEVQGFVAIAYGAMVLMLGPILLPFGIHENTEGMAWQYVKAWLTYGILYLPMCIIAMKICSILITVQATQMNTNILGSWGGMEALIVQTFSVLAAPLAVIGIVFIPNAVLNKVL